MRKLKIAVMITIGVPTLLFCAHLAHKAHIENKTFDKCNTRAATYLPFSFTFGMSRNEAFSHINSNISTDIGLEDSDTDIVNFSIPIQASNTFDMAWVAFKKDRLVALWLNRRLLEESAVPIELWAYKWVSDFEEKSGYTSTKAFNYTGDYGTQWVSENGDSISFEISDLGPQEKYNCISAIELK